MKKLLYLCLMIIVFLTGLHANDGPDMSELVIYTEEFPPLNFMNNGVLTGQSVEVVKEIMENLGCQNEITILPWSDAYQKLLNEPHVVLFSTCLTAERKDLFKWVGPISTVDMYLYTSKDCTMQFSTLEDAKKAPTIAVLKDYASRSILKEKGFDNLVEYNSIQEVLPKLVNGDIKLFPSSNIVMKNELSKLGLNESDVIKSVLISSEYEFIAFSKETSSEVIKAWQETLDELKMDGTFGTIFSKWFPDEVPPGIIQIFTEQYPPLSFSENGQITGYGTEVVREILKDLGIPDNIRMSSWENGYNLCLTMPNFVLYTMKRTPLRDDLFQWVGPIGSNNTIFYAKKGSNLTINSMEDAKKVGKIATCSAWFSEQDLKNAGFTNLVSSPDPRENVRQLIEGEVDLSIFTDITIPDIAKEAGYSIDDLEPLFVVSSGDFYIALSSDTPKHVVKDWQNAFKKMYKDGTLKKLYDKWLPNSTMPEL